MDDRDLKIYSESSGGNRFWSILQRQVKCSEMALRLDTEMYSKGYNITGIFCFFGSSNYLRNRLCKQKCVFLEFS